MIEHPHQIIVNVRAHHVVPNIRMIITNDDDQGALSICLKPNVDFFFLIDLVRLLVHLLDQKVIVIRRNSNQTKDIDHIESE